MLRLVWHQVVHRAGRSLALGLAVLVAATGFTVLTASARASQLETSGTVKANSRTVYDILVRPAHTRSELERVDGLVQPGFLTGVYGGISLDEWRHIRTIHGVEVAAPIAVLGYAFPDLTVPVPIADVWQKTGDSLARVDVDWSWDNGLTRVSQAPDFALITSQPLRPNIGSRLYSHDGAWLISTPRGNRDICPVNQDPRRPDARPETRQPQILCFSRTRGGEGHSTDFQLNGQTAVPVKFPLSYVIAAVDPASEDALVNLSGAVTSGKDLTNASTDYPKSVTGQGVPVLAASKMSTQISATIKVSLLGRDATRAVLEGADQDALHGLPGRVRQTMVVSAQDAHALLLRQFGTAKPKGPPHHLTRFMPGELWRLGQVSLPEVNAATTPPTVRLREPTKPTQPDLVQGVQFQVPGSKEKAARRIATSYKLSTGGGLPDADTVYLRGTFDAAKLAGLQDVTAQVLAGFDAAPTQAGDARSKDLLENQALQPSGYLGGLVQPPPTMITTLSAGHILTDGYTKGHSGAPISAIRVRVAGVHGVDDQSRERVRLVAQRIHDETGLDVDIVTGSSATGKALVLPAGKFGRPQLNLEQQWVKKGVAIAILEQINKKSVALFFLVLIISALSVANAAVSAVRSRRTELGVLACVGWERIHLFRTVLAEITIIATIAGLVSAVMSLGIGRMIGTSVSVQRATLALPAALIVAVAAGLVPAWLAARSNPMDAVRPAVEPPAKPRQPRTVGALARVGVGRVKTRTALAALGLAIAVLVFTVLLAITLAFQGAVVGSILGDTVSIQARAADYAATGASLVLAFLGVANVIYLNIRDRGPELATLRAVGWADSHLDRLVVTEGVLIGAIGATPGAIAGILVATAVTGTLSSAFMIGALIAWAAAMALATTAAALATRLVRRLPTTLLLTE